MIATERSLFRHLEEAAATPGPSPFEAPEPVIGTRNRGAQAVRHLISKAAFWPLRPDYFSYDCRRLWERYGSPILSAPIFISYSSKDQDIAETICKALESRGQSCWISCRDVGAGDNFQEAIVRALREAKVMLLVFTSNANNSDEIKKELVLAGRHQVTVVPVRVEDVVPNDAFSYEFATRQWIDLFKNWEQEIELLSSRLEHVLQAPKAAGAPAGPSVTAPRSFPKKSSNQPLIWGAIALVALIMIGGGVFLMLPSPKPIVAAAPTAAPTVVPVPTPSAPQQTAAQAPAPVTPPPVTPVPAPATAAAPAAPTPAPPPPPAPAPVRSKARRMPHGRRRTTPTRRSFSPAI